MRYAGLNLDWTSRYERIDRRGLPRALRERAGRRVALRWVKRGDSRHRNQYTVVVGVLVPTPLGALCRGCQRDKAESCTHLICIDEGNEITRVHYRNVDALFDLTRKVPA